MCAPLELTGGQPVSMLALPLDGGAPAPCAAQLGGPLVCASLQPAPTRLRAYPLAAWQRGGRAPRAQLSMSEPLVLATGKKGAKRTQFLAYNHTAQLIYLTARSAVEPADLQLVRSTAATPPATVYPPQGSERGPLRLRRGALELQQYCKAAGAGVTCPAPPPPRKRAATNWDPRNPAAVARRFFEETGEGGEDGGMGLKSGIEQVAFNHVELVVES